MPSGRYLARLASRWLLAGPLALLLIDDVRPIVARAQMVVSPLPPNTPNPLAPLPLPLNANPVPKPSNLSRYVRDEAAAIRLGKAFFWDMQAGGDGIQA